MISQGHIAQCLRCQGDSVLIFMSITGSLETSVSGGEHRQGDKSVTSCSNLERREARLLRSRIQSRVGKGPGPQRTHIYLGRSGARDLTGLSCSAHSQVARGCTRERILQSTCDCKLKSWGNFLRESWERDFPEQSISGE